MNLRALSLITFALAVLIWSASVRSEPHLRWLSRVAVAKDASESKAERAKRLAAAERAVIAAAKGDVEILAALVVVGTLESHWAWNIAAGKCGPSQCDRDPETGKVQSRSYFQLQAKACPPIWETDAPPDVNKAAACAARLLRGFRRACGTIDGALSMYGGLACNAMLGKQRGDKVRALLGKRGDA